MIQDVTKRVNIKYFNSFDRMESCLRNHVQSMPTIINSELVQVTIMCSSLVLEFTHNYKFQVSVKQREVFLDKPIQIGFTVLEKR